jgi:hypothetical protein
LRNRWRRECLTGPGGFAGISSQVDIYPDIGYVIVVLGNSDAGGTQAIAASVRRLLAGVSDPPD